MREGVLKVKGVNCSLTAELTVSNMGFNFLLWRDVEDRWTPLTTALIPGTNKTIGA